VFIGGGLIAAAALVVLFQNYPPQPKDAAGTIGAAQRYHEPQITGADVKVSQDELTTWIQSDTFDRILKDRQARRLFADAAVVAMFTDAGRKLQAQTPDVDNLTKLGDGDAVRLKGLVSLEGNDDAARKMVNVALDADAIRKLSAVVDGDTARKLTEVFTAGGDAMRRLSFPMDSDLALKLKLTEYTGSDAARKLEYTGSDAARKLEYKGDDAARRLEYTGSDAALKLKLSEYRDLARTVSPDEARKLTAAINQEYARKLNLIDAGGSDQLRALKVAITADSARKLAEFVGPDAALKLHLNEYADQARTAHYEISSDAARQLREVLGADYSRRLEFIGPDAARKLTFAMDVEQARAQHMDINYDAVRVMALALDNAAISAALNNADFVRALASNASLTDGLVVRSRSEYVEAGGAN
jgi:hypothetical protein